MDDYVRTFAGIVVLACFVGMPVCMLAAVARPRPVSVSRILAAFPRGFGGLGQRWAGS